MRKNGRGSLIRKIAVGIVGGAVLIAGIAMMVLPGPAFVVIPVGLAILATEFPCARRWLVKVKRASKGAVQKFKKRHDDKRNRPRRTSYANTERTGTD